MKKITLKMWLSLFFGGIRLFIRYNDGPGRSYVAYKGSKKRVHKGLDRIVLPENGDSLVVFDKDGIESENSYERCIQKSDMDCR